MFVQGSRLVTVILLLVSLHLLGYCFYHRLDFTLMQPSSSDLHDFNSQQSNRDHHNGLTWQQPNTNHPHDSDPQQWLSDMFTDEERVYFTTGQGDRLKHEPRLQQYVRQLIARPSGHLPLLKEPKTDHSQYKQSLELDDILNGMRNGFFIECGATDGLFMSNTVFFELKRNWTGLLIEADPLYSVPLMKSGRNAFRLASCLSPLKIPSPVSFRLDAGAGLGRIVVSPAHNPGPGGQTTLVCYPLQTVLDAIQVNHVDLFSLDVEGAELDILKTLDWARVTIDVIMLEYAFAPWGQTQEASLKRLHVFEKFLVEEMRLYERVAILPKPKSYADGLDVVFKRKQ